MLIPLAIAAAYLIAGAFIAGLVQAEDAGDVMVVVLLYPLMPVMMAGAWLREIVYSVRNPRP